MKFETIVREKENKLFGLRLNIKLPKARFLHKLDFQVITTNEELSNMKVYYKLGDNT
uniref:Uncharacterized protein n=1 Tax=Anguilla anguilla TaxID=7936 RepID=A0A0E9WRZ6_ANGAN